MTRTRSLVRFVASALLVFMATIAALGGLASAASTSTTASSTTPTTAPGNAITWGIQPATAKGATGKPALVYDNVKPGSTLRSYVGVTNYSTIPATFAVYPADADNTVTGGFDVLNQGQKSVGVGAWTKLDRSSVTIPAGLEDNIPFTIRVPANASPGDHFGGIVAQLSSSTANSKGQHFKFDRRVGVRIYLRVVGPLHPSLTIKHLSVSYHGTVNPFGTGKATVKYTVANTGNVALAGRQTVTITSLFGTLATTRPHSIVNLIPGQSQQVSATLDGIPPAGPIDAHVTLVPAVPKGTTTEPHPKLPHGVATVRQSTGTWAGPWLQFVLFVIVVILVALFHRWRKRRGSKLERAVIAAREAGRQEGEASAKGKEPEGTVPAGSSEAGSPEDAGP